MSSVRSVLSDAASDSPTLNAGQSDAHHRTVRRVLRLWLGFVHPSVVVVRCKPDSPTILHRTVRRLHTGLSGVLYRTVRRALSSAFVLPSIFSCGRFHGSDCVVVPSRVLSLVAISKLRGLARVRREDRGKFLLGSLFTPL